MTNLPYLSKNATLLDQHQHHAAQYPPPHSSDQHIHPPQSIHPHNQPIITTTTTTTPPTPNPGASNAGTTAAGPPPDTAAPPPPTPSQTALPSRGLSRAWRLGGGGTTTRVRACSCGSVGSASARGRPARAQDRLSGCSGAGGGPVLVWVVWSGRWWMHVCLWEGWDGTAGHRFECTLHQTKTK